MEPGEKERYFDIIEKNEEAYNIYKDILPYAINISEESAIYILDSLIDFKKNIRDAANIVANNQYRDNPHYTFISDLKDANDIKGLLINCENNYINSYMNSYIADLENGIDTCIKAKRQGGKHGKK